LILNVFQSNLKLALRKFCKVAALAAGLLPLFAFTPGIDGSYTLTSSETFTSFAPSTFTISDKHEVFDLQSHTATFTGTGNFEVQSAIHGSGAVFINLTDPTKTVTYTGPGNTYSGLTTVRSGTLMLDTSDQADSLVGDLYIGGGPNSAVVTRSDKHNRELIADTSTIRIGANGTLEFNRMDQGNSPVHSSTETFAHLIMDGGTLINLSDNSRNTVLNIGTVTLLADSVWDLGISMTMNIGNVETNAWASGTMLTIKNWSESEPIYVSEISQGQLAQILFDTPQGMMPAIYLPDTQIVPGVIVPEASSFLLVPLLVASALWPEIRQRIKRQKST
jgi:hypothetical protein